MAATGVGIGWFEILMLLLGGGGLVGMPPGDRDAALIKAAPQQALVYIEWTARGAGRPGAPGIDGLMADPEVQQFFSDIQRGLAHEPAAGSDEPEAPNRDAIRLATLIAGHSGCLHASIDPPPQNKGLLSVLAAADVLSQVHICLIINAGADAPAILDALRKTTHTEIPASPQMQAIPGSNGLKLTLHQDGERLLIGFGHGTIERSLAGLRGEVPALDSNARYVAASKRVAAGRFGSGMWIDLKGATGAIVQTLGPTGLLVQTVLRSAGADALDSLAMSTGVVDGNVIQRTFITTGGRTDGVLILAKGSPLRVEQFSHIPADADVVLAASLDMEQLVNGLHDVLARTNPGVAGKIVDEALHELESELGMKLNEDLFPAFGNAWTAFNSPTEGGLMGTGMIVAVEVRDVNKAQVIFERLMKLLEESLSTDPDSEFGSTAELKRHDFLQHSIFYIKRSGGGYQQTTSTSPAFCMTRGHILFALQPQVLKSHLRFLSAPHASFDARTKLPLAGQELLVATYFDGIRATQTVSSVLPFLGQALTDSAMANGWDFDPFSIPSTAALVPYAGDVGMSLSRQKDGLMIESRNPHTATALLGVVGFAKSWFQADYELLMEAKRQRRSVVPVANVGLGAPEGVIPAAAVKPAEIPKEKAGDAAVRRVAPVMIRALVPNEIQPLIPEDVLRRLAEPPSPEVLKEREERRKQLEQRRRERLQKRNLPLPPAPQ
jgi:hypothetical protein